jgi:hypothetical protein
MGVSNLFKKEKNYIDKKEYDKSNIGSDDDNNDLFDNIASIASDVFNDNDDDEDSDDED